MDKDGNSPEAFGTKGHIPNGSYFEQKRLYYWKHGFFLMLLLLVVSNGFWLFQEPEKSVKTSNRLDNSVIPTSEVSTPAVSTSPVSVTPTPSDNLKLQFSLKLPNYWSSKLPVNGVISDEKGEKIGEISGIMDQENSCANYFAQRFTEGGMEKLLDQWTQKIDGKTWFVAHIDVPCLGGCNWNVYCVEEGNKIFSMYLDNKLAQNNPNIINEMLSTFSFND